MAPGQLHLVLAAVDQGGSDLQCRDPHGCPPRSLALLLIECRLSWLRGAKDSDLRIFL